MLEAEYQQDYRTFEEFALANVILLKKDSPYIMHIGVRKAAKVFNILTSTHYAIHVFFSHGQIGTHQACGLESVGVLRKHYYDLHC